MLVVQGEVKLLDFGIAAQMKSAANLAGTLEYLAPELLLGHPPSAQSDLYSVGILLYQTLTGIFPYSRESLTSMLEDLLGEDSDMTFDPGVASFLRGYRRAQNPAAREAGPDTQAPFKLLPEPASLPLPVELPPALSDIVRRLIARQPADRPRDASEALKELSGALHLSVPLETAATRESFLQATELVGRDSELQLLMNGLTQACDGQGSAFVIGGESGIGKSRLLSELRTQALVRGFWVVEGQSVTEGGLYLQEVLPLMRALCIRSELVDSEASLFKPFVPDIAALLGRGVSDPLSTDAEEVQKRLFQLLSQLLGRVKKPLLLLLEDLHWARRETLAWMEHLLQELSGFPILLAATFRSDESPDLLSRFPAARYLLLPRLGSEEISRLSESILGAAGKDPTLVSYLHRQTEGNLSIPHFFPSRRCCNGGGGVLDLAGRAALITLR